MRRCKVQGSFTVLITCLLSGIILMVLKIWPLGYWSRFFQQWSKVQALMSVSLYLPLASSFLIQHKQATGAVWCYPVFWSQKPIIFIVWSGNWRQATASNAVWDGVWKCIWDAADSEVQRARMNDNDGAVCNRLQKQAHSHKTITSVMPIIVLTTGCDIRNQS